MKENNKEKENITSEKVNSNITNFINACNELIEGKFILADIKISKILKIISETTEIYNLIAESMINYDFDREFEKCVIKDEKGSERFELPMENEKIIPLVFCLLVEIDSKRINFNDFIKAQFPFANNQNEEYSSFAKTLIVPFRDAFASIFGVEVKETAKDHCHTHKSENIIDKKLKEKEEDEKHSQNDTNSKHGEITDDPSTAVVIKGTILTPTAPIIETLVEINKQIKEDEEAELLFGRILRITRILEDRLVYIRNPLKKSNIELILDALLEACRVQNVKIIVALVMALNNFAGNDRFMRTEIKELNNICYNFYE